MEAHPKSASQVRHHDGSSEFGEQSRTFCHNGPGVVGYESRFSGAEVGFAADHDIIIDAIRLTHPHHHSSQNNCMETIYRGA